jgi:hypothetical protein
MTTEGAVINDRSARDSIVTGDRVATIGECVLRYGLVLVLGWIGAI